MKQVWLVFSAFLFTLLFLFSNLKASSAIMLEYSDMNATLEENTLELLWAEIPIEEVTLGHNIVQAPTSGEGYLNVSAINSVGHNVTNLVTWTIYPVIQSVNSGSYGIGMRNSYNIYSKQIKIESTASGVYKIVASIGNYEMDTSSLYGGPISGNAKMAILIVMPSHGENDFFIDYGYCATSNMNYTWLFDNNGTLLIIGNDNMNNVSSNLLPVVVFYDVDGKFLYASIKIPTIITSDNVTFIIHEETSDMVNAKIILLDDNFRPIIPISIF